MKKKESEEKVIPGITLMYLQSLTASSHLCDETYPCRTEGYGETAEETREPSALLILM